MTQPEWPDPLYRSVASGPDTPTHTQLTIDCDDPHAQAAFWAAALGYLIEDVHDLVEAVIAAGYAERDRDTIDIDGRRAWRTVTGIKHPADVEGPRGTGRRILFVAVPDRASGRNKLHLDLNVGRERIDAEVARLAGLGATERCRIDEPGAFHTTMADPEGNLFCVQ